MSDDDRRQHYSSSGGHRQCRRRGIVTPDVELGAALALADMAAHQAKAPRPGPAAVVQQQQQHHQPPPPPHAAAAVTTTDDEEEMASTRLSLQLGRVGIRSSPSRSSSSSAGRPSRQPAPAMGTTHGPGRPRQTSTLTEVINNRLSSIHNWDPTDLACVR
jgi:hypothetical protein